MRRGWLPRSRRGVGHGRADVPDAAARQGGLASTGAACSSRPTPRARRSGPRATSGRTRTTAAREGGRARVAREQRPDLGRRSTRRGSTSLACDPVGRQLLDDRPADDAVGQDAAVADARVRGDVAVPADHVRGLVRAAAVLRGAGRAAARASTSATTACARPAGRYAASPEFAISTRTTRRRRAPARTWPKDTTLRAQADRGRRGRPADARRGRALRRVPRRDPPQQARRLLHGARARLPRLGEPRRSGEHLQHRPRRGARRRRADRALAADAASATRWSSRRSTQLPGGSQDVTTISGSMPRRQGVRQSGQSSKSYFTSDVHRRRGHELRRRRRTRSSAAA